MPLIPARRMSAILTYGPLISAGVALAGATVYASSVAVAQDPSAITGMSPAGMDPMMLVYSVAIQAIIALATAVTAALKARETNVDALQAQLADAAKAAASERDAKVELKLKIAALETEARLRSAGP